MSDEAKKCGTCAYQEKGECHRYPPIRENGASVFTHIQVYDWCGEHKPAERTKATLTNVWGKK